MALLGIVFFESALSPSHTPGVAGAAFAAESQAVTAAPPAPSSITIPVPDKGITLPSPGLDVGQNVPGAIPGLAAPLPPARSVAPQTRSADDVLPSIQLLPSQNANGTELTDDTLRQNLLMRQEELTRKEEELNKLEQDITAKLEQMQVLENRLKVMMRDADSTRDAKLRHLVDVLANTKAKQAALVIETLDQSIAVSVLANMRGRQAGEVLTYIEPKRAAQLAEALARMQMPME